MLLIGVTRWREPYRMTDRVREHVYTSVRAPSVHVISYILVWSEGKDMRSASAYHTYYNGDMYSLQKEAISACVLDYSFLCELGCLWSQHRYFTGAALPPDILFMRRHRLQIQLQNIYSAPCSMSLTLSIRSGHPTVSVWSSSDSFFSMLKIQFNIKYGRAWTETERHADIAEC